MPLYEYRCRKCGALFEKLIMHSPSVDYTHCFCTNPTCFGGIAVKEMSAPSFKINGFNEANGYAAKGSE